MQENTKPRPNDLGYYVAPFQGYDSGVGSEDFAAGWCPFAAAWLAGPLKDLFEDIWAASPLLGRSM
ncbi:MAG: hypothetical protein SPI56_07745 [Alloprevotella sp.]|nr:hypothetical protein [Alloprevotella sp.]